MSIRNILKSFIDENPDIDKDEVNINIAEILNDAKNKNSHLYNKTLNDINNELLVSVGYDDNFYNKLKDNYRVIHHIDDLHIGKYIRWFVFKKNKPDEPDEELKLTNGGFIIKITPINPDRSKILCKIGKNIFINIIFEDTIVFQKLSLQESIILEIGNTL